MGRVYDVIDESLRTWVARQPMFFVGTAPLDSDGHINISPKGSAQTFAVLGERHVAYVDLVGSGIETTAHLQENGRIVVMFCAFEGPPKIVRFHGTGRSIPRDSPGFAEVIGAFRLDEDVTPLVRSVIVIDVDRISDSCGFVVPEMILTGERTQLQRWAEVNAAKNGPGWLTDYIAAKNETSIDGLPGMSLKPALNSESSTAG